MPYPSIIAFVEGKMERLFINNNFHYVDVVPVSNGISISAEKLASNIASLYRAKSKLPDYIVVWVDGEGRPQSSKQIRKLIWDEMVAAGAPDERLRIGVPDKMSENWIMADQDLIRSEFALPNYVYAGDGTNGKHSLKMLCLAANITYKETKIGSNLLKKMRLSRASDFSPSASDFSLAVDGECWWLEA